jgi:hypothetical protein
MTGRRGPAEIVNDRLIISSERLYKDYDSRWSFEKKILVVRRQDELIGGKSPVVK